VPHLAPRRPVDSSPPRWHTMPTSLRAHWSALFSCAFARHRAVAHRGLRAVDVSSTCGRLATSSLTQCTRHAWTPVGSRIPLQTCSTQRCHALYESSHSLPARVLGATHVLSRSLPHRARERFIIDKYERSLYKGEPAAAAAPAPAPVPAPAVPATTHAHARAAAAPAPAPAAAVMPAHAVEFGVSSLHATGRRRRGSSGGNIVVPGAAAAPAGSTAPASTNPAVLRRLAKKHGGDVTGHASESSDLLGISDPVPAPAVHVEPVAHAAHAAHGGHTSQAAGDGGVVSFGVSSLKSHHGHHGHHSHHHHHHDASAPAAAAPPASTNPAVLRRLAKKSVRCCCVARHACVDAFRG
jgi:hypothetical protein